MKRRTTRARNQMVAHHRPGRFRARFARALRVVLALASAIAVLCVLGTLISKAARPYLISHAESKEISEINRQIAEANAENRALKKEIAYLSTPEGKEAEARKLGWVKAGEVAIVIEQPQDSQGEGGQSADSSGRESFWHAAGRRILGLFVRTDSRDQAP